MVASQGYSSRFENRYGEEWKFEYDPIRGEGLLSGSDVNWQEYRVVDRQAIGLVLNEEEVRWLQAAWEAAITGR